MRIASSIVSFSILFVASLAARAQDAPAEPAPTVAGSPAPAGAPAAAEVPERKLGVGYKLGNGLGVLGADVVVAPIEHIALDVQVNYYSAAEPEGTAHGYGFAPAIQGRLFGGQRSTPYADVGWAHMSLSLQNVTASGNAVFANVGYEFRWDFGLGVLLGAGAARLGKISATDGVTTIAVDGGTMFNLEAGVRYMFY
jgi:hypothetical protein